MPCYVYYSDSTHLIEEAIKLRNYIHIALDAKQQIGRIFDKAKDLQFPQGQCWPFDVIDKDSMPYVQEIRKIVDGDVTNRGLTAPEISNLVYRQAKREAESLLGRNIAVGTIAFPDHLNIKQRQDFI